MEVFFVIVYLFLKIIHYLCGDNSTKNKNQLLFYYPIQTTHHNEKNPPSPTSVGNCPRNMGTGRSGARTSEG
jgi:hypothetical protein